MLLSTLINTCQVSTGYLSSSVKLGTRGSFHCPVCAEQEADEWLGHRKSCFGRLGVLALLFFYIYCFTHTTYNATLTLPTLHTLIKILTLFYITVPNAALGKNVFTDLVFFKYCIFPFFFKKTKQSFSLLTLLYLHHSRFLSFLGTHTHIHVPVK